MRFYQLVSLLPIVAFAASGCHLIDHEAISNRGHSPLHAALQSPDSVAIEMMWVRFPADDPQMNDAAWQAIDETRIDPAVRRELANNGFRVGVITGALPDAMSRALAAGDGKPPHDAAAGNGTKPASGNSELSIAQSSADLTKEPQVRGRVRQLRRQERWEIQASDVIPTMPLLMNNGREMSGRSYPDAQAIYALRIDPRPDRTVLMELTPEVQYGPPKLRYTGGEEGILRQERLRDRQVFERMQMKVQLAPGEMLVLMALPNAGSRLGDYFHTVDAAEGRQQKMILLRLAQVPASSTFDGDR